MSNGTPLAPKVVAIGGSMRPGSSTELALRAVLAAVGTRGADVSIFTGADLVLAPYEPGVVDAPARRMLDAVASADAVVIGSPGYHGTVSGLVKNALDYLEELREGPRCYLDGIPVASVATAYGWQAAVNTLGTLRVLVHSLRGWPTPMGLAINMASAPVFCEDGTVLDQSVAGAVQIVAQQLLTFPRALGSEALAPAAALT